MKGKIQNTPYLAFLLLFLVLLIGLLSCDFYKLVTGQQEKRSPTDPCFELIPTPTPVPTPTPIVVPTFAPPEQTGESPGNGNGNGPGTPTITVTPTAEPENPIKDPTSGMDPYYSDYFFEKSQLVSIRVNQSSGTRILRDIEGFKAVLKLNWKEKMNVMNFSEPVSFVSVKLQGNIDRIGTLKAFDLLDNPVDMDISSSEFYVAGKDIVKLELYNAAGDIGEITFRPEL